MQRALDAVTAGPAFVRNGRMDILAVNPLGKAFWADVFAAPGLGNLARFTFLDPERARIFHPDWEAAADVAVAGMRTEAGRDPHNKDLQDLIGELSTRSDAFRARWGAHNVRRHGTGEKAFHHTVVGDLTLTYEGLELTTEPDLSFLIYTAEPGSPPKNACGFSPAGPPATKRKPQPQPRLRRAWAKQIGALPEHRTQTINDQRLPGLVHRGDV
nr:hypothetical protein [Arthrobacter sp. ISL-69]